MLNLSHRPALTVETFRAQCVKSFENSHKLSKFLAVTTAMAEMTSSWTNSAARHAKTVSGEAAPDTQQQLLSSRFGACLKTGHFFVVHLLIMSSCSRNFFEGVMTCTNESHLQDEIFLHGYNTSHGPLFVSLHHKEDPCIIQRIPMNSGFVLQQGNLFRIFCLTARHLFGHHW